MDLKLSLREFSKKKETRQRVHRNSNKPIGDTNGPPQTLLLSLRAPCIVGSKIANEITTLARETLEIIVRTSSCYDSGLLFSRPWTATSSPDIALCTTTPRLPCRTLKNFLELRQFTTGIETVDAECSICEHSATPRQKNRHYHNYYATVGVGSKPCVQQTCDEECYRTISQHGRHKPITSSGYLTISSCSIDTGRPLGMLTWIFSADVGRDLRCWCGGKDICGPYVRASCSGTRSFAEPFQV